MIEGRSECELHSNHNDKKFHLVNGEMYKVRYAFYKDWEGGEAFELN